MNKLDHESSTVTHLPIYPVFVSPQTGKSHSNGPHSFAPCCDAGSGQRRLSQLPSSHVTMLNTPFSLFFRRQRSVSCCSPKSGKTSIDVLYLTLCPTSMRSTTSRYPDQARRCKTTQGLHSTTCVNPEPVCAGHKMLLRPKKMWKAQNKEPKPKPRLRVSGNRSICHWIFENITVSMLPRVITPAHLKRRHDPLMKTVSRSRQRKKSSKSNITRNTAASKQRGDRNKAEREIAYYGAPISEPGYELKEVKGPRFRNAKVLGQRRPSTCQTTLETVHHRLLSQVTFKDGTQTIATPNQRRRNSGSSWFSSAEVSQRPGYDLGGAVIRIYYPETYDSPAHFADTMVCDPEACARCEKSDEAYSSSTPANAGLPFVHEADCVDDGDTGLEFYPDHTHAPSLASEIPTDLQHRDVIYHNGFENLSVPSAVCRAYSCQRCLARKGLDEDTLETRREQENGPRQTPCAEQEQWNSDVKQLVEMNDRGSEMESNASCDSDESYRDRGRFRYEDFNKILRSRTRTGSSA